MKKPLRAKLVDELGRALVALDPAFTGVTIKSPYVWAGEAVWQRQRGGITDFVILVPERKHGDDTFTVEVAWSHQGRFPELVRRPWLVSTEQIGRAHELPEGSVRLSFLVGMDLEWTSASEPLREASLARWVAALKDSGLGFLEALRP